jgi:hypothetical protein
LSSAPVVVLLVALFVPAVLWA